MFKKYTKKLLLSSLMAISLLSIGIFYVTPVNAEERTYKTSEEVSSLTPEQRSAYETQLEDWGREDAAQAEADMAEMEEEEQVASACFSWTGGFNIPNCFDTVVKLTGNVILTLVAWILWLVSKFFELTLNYSILNFRDFLVQNSTTGAGGPPFISSINTIWKTFRDLINITYIFILLYTAIGTILNLEGVNYEKTIKNVIISALFINFSMFITKALIDVSNIFTIKIYEQVITTKNSDGTVRNSDISSTILNNLKLATFYQTEPSDSLTAAGDKMGMSNLSTFKFVEVVLMASIFMLLTAFILIAAAILLLIRAIILIFLLMTSPIAFAPDELKMLLKRDLKKEWWEKLKSNLLFAPAYMFMMYIAMKTAASMSETTEGGFVSAFQNISGLGIMINFVFIIILMAMALIVAVQFGAVGSKVMEGWMNSMKGGLLKAPLRPIAAMSDRLSKSRFGNTWVGSKLNNASFGKLSKIKIAGSSIADDRKKEGKARTERYKNYAEATQKSKEKEYDRFSSKNPRNKELKEDEKRYNNLIGEAKDNNAAISTKEGELASINTEIENKAKKATQKEQEEIEKNEKELLEMKGSPLAAMNAPEIKQKEQEIAAKRTNVQKTIETIKTKEHEKVQQQTEALKTSIATLKTRKIDFDKDAKNATAELEKVITEQKELAEEREGAILKALGYSKDDASGQITDKYGIKQTLPTDAKSYATAYKNGVADRIENAEPGMIGRAVNRHLPTFKKGATTLIDNNVTRAVGIDQVPGYITGSTERRTRRNDYVKEMRGVAAREREKKAGSVESVATRVGENENDRNTFVDKLSKEHRDALKEAINKKENE
ncbi:MAG: hypothetical protein WC757_01630 [Candidatus Paceibacterota bacterium]|jgi:hypothetical protein